MDSWEDDGDDGEILYHKLPELTARDELVLAIVDDLIPNSPAARELCQFGEETRIGPALAIYAKHMLDRGGELPSFRQIVYDLTFCRRDIGSRSGEGFEAEVDALYTLTKFVFEMERDTLVDGPHWMWVLKCDAATAIRKMQNQRLRVDYPDPTPPASGTS